jgi:hypothetical protein
MSCHPKRTRAIPQCECASIPGHRINAGHDQHRVIGRAQYVTHHSMPNIMLAADEQADITAYIMSLK